MYDLREYVSSIASCSSMYLYLIYVYEEDNVNEFLLYLLDTCFSSVNCRGEAISTTRETACCDIGLSFGEQNRCSNCYSELN